MDTDVGERGVQPAAAARVLPPGTDARAGLAEIVDRTSDFAQGDLISRPEPLA